MKTERLLEESNLVVKNISLVDIHEICLHFKLEQESATLSDEYHSVGGVIFKVLGHIPQVGEKLTWAGLVFEVVDMDGHRIDKVLITANLNLK